MFCHTANWLRQEIFWGVTQQCIPALCGALTRISCRPLQPLETSSCYQVAQLAAKDLIDLFWMWYTNSLSNPFPSVFPSIFNFFFSSFQIIPKFSLPDIQYFCNKPSRMGKCTIWQATHWLAQDEFKEAKFSLLDFNAQNWQCRDISSSKSNYRLSVCVFSCSLFTVRARRKDMLMHANVLLLLFPAFGIVAPTTSVTVSVNNK